MRIPLPRLGLSFTAQQRVDRCYSIADLRRVAKRRLPRGPFDYIDGAAEDETTLRRNAGGFERYDLLPRVLNDVGEVDTRTTVLGQEIDFPVILAPTGLTRLTHPDGDREAARAAADAGTIYTLSAMASTNIEDLAAASDGPKWFQIYVWRDRELVHEFFDRCRDSGYQTLALTVDVPVFGQRERDLRNGMTIPPRPTLSTVFDAALHPSWWWGYLRMKPFTLANVEGRGEAGRNDVTTLVAYMNEQMDPSVTWDDLAWMVEKWDGPFAIKGVLRPEDARRAVDMGVKAVIVGNHGGRQLDGAAAAIDALPGIVEAVGEDAEVILDGGVRRGTDIVKALALGARACSVGRPFLYGLGAGGRVGVARSLELLRLETRRAMALAGAASVDELDASFVRERWDAPRGAPSS